jgi:hypothetical protein
MKIRISHLYTFASLERKRTQELRTPMKIWKRSKRRMKINSRGSRHLFALQAWEDTAVRWIPKNLPLILATYATIANSYYVRVFLRNSPRIPRLQLLMGKVPEISSQKYFTARWVVHIKGFEPVFFWDQPLSKEVHPGYADTY